MQPGKISQSKTLGGRQEVARVNVTGLAIAALSEERSRAAWGGLPAF